MKYSLDQLRQVKGIGEKTIQRIIEQFDESEYVSRYDPSIHIEPGSLIQGDMLEVMNGIPDNSIDMIVTDPPYLIDYKTNYRKNKQHDFCSAIKGDNDKNLIKYAIKESYRILKPNSAMYMFCSPNTIDFFKVEVERYFKIKNIIIWKKNNWTAGDLQASFGKQYEMIILANKGRKKFNGKRLTDIWEFDRVSGKKQLHQNQKPVELIEQMIEKHSNAGDLVVDMFMGSGSTGVACKNLNRKFIGIELDKEYFEIAKRRIENE